MRSTSQEQGSPVPAQERTLADGGRAVHARPASPRGAVLLLTEAFGLNAHFVELTERFAAAGYEAITPDLHQGATYAYGDLPGALAHLRRLDEGAAMARVGAALDALGRPADQVALVGFCLGGRLAFRGAAELADRVGAAVCFYGGGIAPAQDPFGRPGLLPLAAAIRCPLRLWYGGQDALIRPDEHGRIAQALGEAGVAYTLSVIPAATHGFFCALRASHHPGAAAQAWAGTLDFLDATLAGPRVGSATS